MSKTMKIYFILMLCILLSISCRNVENSVCVNDHHKFSTILTFGAKMPDVMIGSDEVSVFENHFVLHEVGVGDMLTIGQVLLGELGYGVGGLSKQNLGEIDDEKMVYSLRNIIKYFDRKELAYDYPWEKKTIISDKDKFFHAVHMFLYGNEKDARKKSAMHFTSLLNNSKEEIWKGYSLLFLAYIYYDKYNENIEIQNIDKSLKYYKLFLKRYKNNHSLSLTCKYMIAKIYENLSDSQNAIKYYQDILSNYQEYDDWIVYERAKYRLSILSK